MLPTIKSSGSQQKFSTWVTPKQLTNSHLEELDEILNEEYPESPHKDSLELSNSDDFNKIISKYELDLSSSKKAHLTESMEEEIEIEK